MTASLWPRDAEILPVEDARIVYWPNWVGQSEADDWFLRLLEQAPWTQPSVRLFGKVHRVPRLVSWYGDAQASYRYSGITHQPLPWTPLLDAIRQRVSAQAGAPLNGVLLNYYRDGQDAMGWHCDDEPELGRDPLIASLSLGGPRRFDLRRRAGGPMQHSLLLEHGSLLVMSGPTQHHWQHRVARSRRLDAPRLNLTFRLLRGTS